MTKAELVALITHQTGVEKTAAEAVVEAFMRNIKETMIAGEDVFLRGFGSFIVKERAEKVARNITKNTTMVIPAHSIPAFKPSKVFLEAVKEGNKKDKTLVLSGVAWYHSAPSDNEKRNRLSTAVAFLVDSPYAASLFGFIGPQASGWHTPQSPHGSATGVFRLQENRRKVGSSTRFAALHRRPTSGRYSCYRNRGNTRSPIAAAPATCI